MGLVSGQRLGLYEIDGPLSSGGMGEVYRAQDTKLGRHVAIKVLPEALAHSPDRLARFEREARILASLNHPNIATIYSFEDCQNIRFLAMELIAGETLSKIIAAAPLPCRRALLLSRQITEALEAAHSQGVVHRDLKPLNIMVTPDEKAKVLDFGLAKGLQPGLTTDELSQSPTLVAEETAPGTILGTSSYMSPEQARGRSTDSRSDIWAFGCVLFEMLSGQKAFDGETLSDKFAAILTREPDWKALPGDIPGKIKDLICRCLEKDKDRRLADIHEARRILDEVLEAKPIAQAEPIPPGSQRRRLLAATAAMLLIACATGWITMKSRADRGSPTVEAKLLVVLPFKDLSGHPSGQLIGEGMVETLSARFAQIPNIQVIMPTEVIAASDKETDPFRVAGNLGGNLLMQGAVQRNGDQVRITFSVWSTQKRSQIAGGTVDGTSSNLFGMQDRLAENLINSLRLARAPIRSVSPDGLETAAQQEQYIKAIGNLQRYDKDASVDEAIELLETLAAERPNVALVQAALGRAYLDKFNLTHERKWSESALASCERARLLNSELPEVDVTLGEVRRASGQANEAIPAFQRALTIQPNNYGALLGLAAAFNAAGHLPDAEATYQRAIRLQPSYWGGYSKLGGFHFTHGNYTQAAEMFRRVTELAPDNARAYANLGGAYQSMGSFSRALAAYKQSLALSPTSLAYSNIGTLEFFAGHPMEAVEAYEAALKLTPQYFEVWANLGDAYRWAPGLQGKAPEAYAKAIALCKGELRLNPQSSIAHSVLALSLAKTGKLRDAEEEVRKALSIDPHNPELLYNAAIVANAAGRETDALTWINQASKDGYPRVFIAREPEFQNLRSHPAFKEAVQNQN